MTSPSGNGADSPGTGYAYVLITPARDEAKFIEETIKSVVAQTVLPLKWVIVSDGSTDGTDDIVKRYLAEYPWIELLRMPERQERNFAGKVMAFNAGYDRVRHLPYKYLACMDADISFEPDYFAYLLDKACSDSRFGMVGTAFREEKMSYDYRFVGIEHVSGPCQLFRRECYEDIGGYVPIRGGGVDHVAVLTARMRGWKTRCFTEKLYHHREMGSVKHGPLGYKFYLGKQDYRLGSHPLWEVFRVAYQMTKRPRILGGMMIGAGYIYEALTLGKRPIPKELVHFRRGEQMARLKHKLFGNIGAVS
jgi:glycosyltransferase involved in cell wall biosynthesis